MIYKKIILRCDEEGFSRGLSNYFLPEATDRRVSERKKAFKFVKQLSIIARTKYIDIQY
jgi:hypothetical protein